MSEDAILFHDTASQTLHLKPLKSEKITNVRGRWLGYTNIKEFFLCEFSEYTEESLLVALESGEIRVNGDKVTHEYKFKSKDEIHNISIWKEKYIPAKKIVIVHQDEHYVVIHKPSGVCVHAGPSVRYLHALNILTWALGGYLKMSRDESSHQIIEYPIGLFSIPSNVTATLKPCHRIDKNTSGVCVFACTTEAAKAFANLLFQKSLNTDISVHIPQNPVNDIVKKYYALVTGNFPNCKEIAGLQSCGHPSGVIRNSPDQSNNNSNEWFQVQTKMIQDKQNHICTLPRPCDIQNVVREPCNDCAGLENPSNTPARTQFRKMKQFGTQYSLIEAFPQTGRTHQIRSQLWWLGYPIVNDEQYGGQPMLEDLNEDTLLHEIRQQVWNMNCTEEYTGNRSSSIFQHAHQIELHTYIEVPQIVEFNRVKKRKVGVEPKQKYVKPVILLPYSSKWSVQPSWMDGHVQNNLHPTKEPRKYPDDNTKN